MICPHCGMYVNLKGTQILQKLRTLLDELPESERVKIRPWLLAMADRGRAS